MANTILTPSMILREVYALMHQRSNFIMRTNRQYDSRFANNTLKIGQSLDIRLPPKFTTRTGNTMASQNITERAVALPLATINGVDFNLTQEQLTFDIQDLSERVLRPAVAQLTATVEANAMATLYKKVPNYVGIVTTASTTVYRDFANAARLLTDNKAPLTDRTMTMDTQTTVDFRDAIKGLFQQGDKIAEAYVEGSIGRTGGFDVYENTLTPRHTSGTFTATTISVTTTAGSTGFFDGTGNAYSNDPFTVSLDGITTGLSLKAGDVVTFSAVNEVDTETKQDLGYLKKFVVTEDSGALVTAGTIKILPVPIVGGAYANVSAAILNNAVMTFLGPATTAAAITYGQNLGFHKDAFAFVTADLEDPSKYGAWGGREVMDDLSVRIWRQGDIVNGQFLTRLDIAWGVAAIYPEWAVRWVHAQS